MEELFMASNDGELSFVEANGKIVVEEGTQGFVPAVQGHSMIYATQPPFYVVQQSAQQQTSQCFVQARQRQVYATSNQDQGSILILQQPQQGTNYILQPQQAHVLRDAATGQQIYTTEPGVIQVPQNIPLAGKVATTTSQQAVALGVSSPQQNVIQMPQITNQDSVPQNVNVQYHNVPTPRAKRPAQPRGSILRLPNSPPQAYRNLNQEQFLKQLEQKTAASNAAAKKSRGGKVNQVAQQRRMVSQQLSKSPDKAVQSESSQMSIPIVFNGADTQTTATINPDETVTISINEDQNQNLLVTPASIDQSFTRQVRGRGRKANVQQERAKLSKQAKLNQLQQQALQQPESQNLDIIAELSDAKASSSSNAAVQTQSAVLLQQPQIVKQVLKGDHIVLASSPKIPQQQQQLQVQTTISRQSTPLAQQPPQQAVHSLERQGRSVCLTQAQPQQIGIQQVQQVVRQIPQVQRGVQQQSQIPQGATNSLGQRCRTPQTFQVANLPPDKRALVLKRLKEQQQSGAVRVIAKTKENCQLVSINEVVDVSSGQMGESKAIVASLPPGKKVASISQRSFPPGSIRVIADTNGRKEQPLQERSSPASLATEENFLLCRHCGILCDNRLENCQRCKHVLRKNTPATAVVSSNQEEKTHTSVFSSASPSPPSSIALNKQELFAKVAAANKRIQPEKRLAMPSTRGRGRGRGRGRPIDEPVILTLSSDEEDSNDKNEASNPSPGLESQSKADDSNPPRQYELVNRKEPIITEVMDEEPSNMDAVYGGGCRLDEIKTNLREMESLSIDKIIGEYSLVGCRSVRIGSYKCTPCNRVLFFSQGIRMTVPSINNPEVNVILNIPITSIVKMLCYFGATVPVFFLYIRPTIAAHVRKLLKMNDRNSFYYDPCSKRECQRRITILPEKTHEDMKSVMKNLYLIPFSEGDSSFLMDELDQKESNDILVISCPSDDANLMLKDKVISYESKTLLIYPTPPIKGAITITTDDYICLEEEQFLNDVIIDFYLKWLHLTKLSEGDQKRTHIFSTFFYKRLTSKPKKGRRIGSSEDDPSLSQAEKRHSRVKSWTKAVDIFEKDFIVIPINEHSHWFLAIICFPGLDGPVRMCDSHPVPKAAPQKRKARPKITHKIEIPIIDDIEWSDRDEAEGDEDELYDDDEDEEEAGSPADTDGAEPPPKKNKAEEAALSSAPEETSMEAKPAAKEVTGIKQPCILIFDSLAGASRSRIVATLREYLMVEHQVKRGFKKVFDRDSMKGASPKVPQQMNFSDCGIFTLQYAETFFEQPLLDYSLPMKKLSEWFSQEVVRSKREGIAKLIQDLMNKYKPNHGITLPEILFNSKEFSDTCTGKNRPDAEAATKSKEMQNALQKQAEEKSEGGKGAQVNVNSISQDKFVTAVTKSLKKVFLPSSDVLPKENCISINVSDPSFIEAPERQNQMNPGNLIQEPSQPHQPITTLPPTSSNDKTVIVDCETSEVLLIVNPGKETSPEPEKGDEGPQTASQMLADPASKPVSFRSLETPKTVVSRDRIVHSAITNKAVCVTTPSSKIKKVPLSSATMTSVGLDVKQAAFPISNTPRTQLPPCHSIRNPNVSSIRGSVLAAIPERPQITKFVSNSKRTIAQQPHQKHKVASPIISASWIQRSVPLSISSEVSSPTDSIRFVNSSTGTFSTASNLPKECSVATFHTKNNMNPVTLNSSIVDAAANVSKDDSYLTSKQGIASSEFRDSKMVPPPTMSANPLQSNTLGEVTFRSHKPNVANSQLQPTSASTLKELLRSHTSSPIPTAITTLNVSSSSMTRLPTAAINSASNFRNISSQFTAPSRTVAEVQNFISSQTNSSVCQFSTNAQTLQTNLLQPSQAEEQPPRSGKVTHESFTVDAPVHPRYSHSPTLHNLTNTTTPSSLSSSDNSLTSLSQPPHFSSAATCSSFYTFSNVISSSKYTLARNTQSGEPSVPKQKLHEMTEARDNRIGSNSPHKQTHVASSMSLLNSNKYNHPSAQTAKNPAKLTSSELFDQLTGHISVPTSIVDGESTSSVQSQVKNIPKTSHSSLVYSELTAREGESANICSNVRQPASNINIASQGQPSGTFYASNMDGTNQVSSIQKITNIGSSIATEAQSASSASFLMDSLSSEIPASNSFSCHTVPSSLYNTVNCPLDKPINPATTERAVNFNMETSTYQMEGQGFVNMQSSNKFASPNSKPLQDQISSTSSPLMQTPPKISTPSSVESSPLIPLSIHQHSTPESEGTLSLKSSTSLSSPKDEVIEIESTSSSQDSSLEASTRESKLSISRYTPEQSPKKALETPQPSEQVLPSVFKFSERGTSSGRTIAPPKRYLDSVEDEVVRKKRPGFKGRMQR